jgi:hypothetical protein
MVNGDFRDAFMRGEFRNRIARRFSMQVQAHETGLAWVIFYLRKP